MNYKLLDATYLFSGYYYEVEYKDLVLRFKKDKHGFFLYFYCSNIIYGNGKNLIGENITHQGIPEDLKNYLDDPLFEIELEKYIQNSNHKRF